MMRNTHGQLKTKVIESEAEPITREYQWGVHKAEFEKPDGWDYWDDWIPEAFDSFQQHVASGSTD